MTIYVDELHDFGGDGVWCHLMTDSDDLEELHGFAQRIGLKREWFQDHSRHPHYDLAPSKRALAVKRGAVEVTATEMLLECLRI